MENREQSQARDRDDDKSAPDRRGSRANRTTNGGHQRQLASGPSTVNTSAESADAPNTQARICRSFSVPEADYEKPKGANFAKLLQNYTSRFGHGESRERTQTMIMHVYDIVQSHIEEKQIPLVAADVYSKLVSIYKLDQSGLELDMDMSTVLFLVIKIAHLCSEPWCYRKPTQSCSRPILKPQPRTQSSRMDQTFYQAREAYIPPAVPSSVFLSAGVPTPSPPKFAAEPGKRSSPPVRMPSTGQNLLDDVRQARNPNSISQPQLPKEQRDLPLQRTVERFNPRMESGKVAEDDYKSEYQESLHQPQPPEKRKMLYNGRLDDLYPMSDPKRRISGPNFSYRRGSRQDSRDDRR